MVSKPTMESVYVSKVTVMPFIEQPQHQGFVARMIELTSSRTPWHRRLWRTGTLRLGNELLIESANPALPDAALKDMRGYLQQAIGPDMGVGEHRRELQAALQAIRPGITESSHGWLVLREHLHRSDSMYLENWAKHFASRREVDVETAARKILSHLFDHGLHKNSVYAWLASIHGGNDEVSVSDFIREAAYRTASPPRIHTFCVPVSTKPSFLTSGRGAEGWMDATETSRWKQTHAADAQSIRHQGAFLLALEARDINAAVDQARAKIFDLRAQFELGARRPVQICDHMWSKDRGKAYATRATDRSIEIRSFERLDCLAALDTPSFLSNALALIEPLRNSPPHLAIMSGWSAIESLLVGDADDRDSVAADRFATIVAASMLRAELTALAWAYSKDGIDDTSTAIAECATNSERAKIMQRTAMCRDGPLPLSQETDNLALARIRPALTDPKSEISKIKAILAREFMRLYRKRNLIAHAGHTNEETLHLTSEIMTPLIGAGIDRIAYAGLKYDIQPIELSATLEARIPYLTPATAAAAGNLIDLFEFNTNGPTSHRTLSSSRAS